MSVSKYDFRHQRRNPENDWKIGQLNPDAVESTALHCFHVSDKAYKKFMRDIQEQGKSHQHPTTCNDDR